MRRPQLARPAWATDDALNVALSAMVALLEALGTNDRGGVGRLLYPPIVEATPGSILTDSVLSVMKLDRAQALAIAHHVRSGAAKVGVSISAGAEPWVWCTFARPGGTLRLDAAYIDGRWTVLPYVGRAKRLRNQIWARLGV